MSSLWQRDHYLFRRKFWKLFGAAFYVLDPNDEANMLMYSKQKAFKLKEDIRIYTDESMSEELLIIKARNIIDISASYDVYDARNDEHIGVLQRKGLKSMIRDEWLIKDTEEVEVGMIQEDSTALALVRRFLFNLLPQGFTISVHGNPVAHLQQTWNPFVPRLHLTFNQKPEEEEIDRRLTMAAALMIMAVEGRQQ